MEKTTIQKLATDWSTFEGYSRRGDNESLVPFVAFGKDAFEFILTQKEKDKKYKTSVFIADLQEAGAAKHSDSAVYNAVKAGKLLATSQEDSFPCLGTKELCQCLSAFGKVDSSGWKAIAKAYRNEGLSGKDLLARFGLVKVKETAEKPTEETQEVAPKLDQLLALIERQSKKHGIALQDVLNGVQALIEKPLKEAAERQAKIQAEAQARQARLNDAWNTATQDVVTFISPISGATIYLYTVAEQEALKLQILADKKALEEAQHAENKRLIAGSKRKK